MNTVSTNCCADLEQGLGKVQLVAILAWTDPAELLIPVDNTTKDTETQVNIRVLLLLELCAGIF